MTSSLTMVVLFAAFSVQVLGLGWQRKLPPPTGPRPGTLLPDVMVIKVDQPGEFPLMELILEKDGCSLLAIVSPTCPTCSRMRVTWPGRFSAWADSVGNSVRPIWVGDGGMGNFSAFAREYPLDGIELAVWAPGTVRQAWKVLGVVATPTLYLIDSTGVVRAGKLGETLPPVDLARQACQ